MKYYWDLTCSACPEQYDIYRKKGDKKKIAYARYRWEGFSVYCPDVLKTDVYCNGGLVDKVPDEWKLEAEEAIDKYYKQEETKKETIKDIVDFYPKLSKGVSKKLLSALYDAAFSDGIVKHDEDILDEYIQKQGCKKCEHYKMGLIDYYCELDECSFKEKKNETVSENKAH